MNIDEKIALTRKIITDNVGKFITVSFIKKDGTLRTMQCHKSKLLESTIKGTQPEATAARHMTLERNGMLQVEEVTPEKTYQFRTVNLKTIQRIAADGVVYQFN